LFNGSRSQLIRLALARLNIDPEIEVRFRNYRILGRRERDWRLE